MNPARRRDPRAPAVDPIACRLTRRWVRLYTGMVAGAARDRRRAEIDSDLWEQLAEARANEQSRTNAQIAVVARMLAGVPADLSWARRVRRTTKEQRSMKQRVLGITAVSCILVALASLFGTNLLVDKSTAETGDTIWWVLAIPIGFMLVGTIGLVASGLFIRERRKVRAATV